MTVVCFKSHSKHQALFAVIAFSFIIAVTDGCTYDYDCDFEMNQVCCNSECDYGSSCIGQYCTSDANCSSDESCCLSECTSGDCLGSSCSNDTDCEVFERCCYGTCKYANEECYDPLSPGELAAVSISSIVGPLSCFICLIAACACTSGRRTAPTTRRVAQTNPPQRVTSTIYTRCVVQRSYQQAYPCHTTHRLSRRPVVHRSSIIHWQQEDNLPLTLQHQKEDQGEYVLLNPHMVLYSQFKLSSDSHKNVCFSI